MKFLKLALVAAAASVAMSGAAMAEELKLSYNVGVASDYIFRGISQTSADPQVFGGVDATYGIGYAGVWASNVDFGISEPSAEIDLYAGIRPTQGDVNFDFGVLYYSYVKDEAPKTSPLVASPGSFSYFEFKGAASKAFGPATLGVAVYYSPEFPLEGGKSIYYELNGSAPIAHGLTLSGAIGRQEVDAEGYFSGVGNEYNTLNVGISKPFGDHLTADLRYSNTDAHEFGKKLYGSELTVSLKAAF
jgi:uncharacterized protein (TIGR02001 family)